MVRALRLIFLNSLAQLIGKIITALATVLITALVARSLGQSGFGGFTLMTAYAGLFYVLADFGFNAVVIRQMQGDESRLPQFFRSLLGLRLVYGTGLVILSLIILNFLPYNPLLKTAMIISVMTILTQAVYNTASLAFQSKLRYDLATIAQAAGSIIYLGLIYLLAQGDINLILVAFSILGSGVVMALLALQLAKSLTHEIKPTFNIAEWRDLISTALPVGLTLSFNLVYFRADTFILSFLKPTADVGVYGAAYKLFELALVLPTFFMNSIYPLLVRSQSESPERFNGYVKFSLIGLAGAGIIGAGLGIYLASPIITLIYGDHYPESILPFQILIASIPIYFVSNLYMWLLIILKKQKPLAVIYAFGMFLNVLLNIYFIPQYSYLASAIITGVSEAVILVMTFYLARGWHK